MYLLLRTADNAVNGLNEAKKVRTTTAVVKAKEHVRFDEKNRSYVSNLDEPIQMPPGAEQWRIYYQIDNFDQVPEPKRNELWRSEEARIEKFGYRFYTLGPSDKTAYDEANIGDRLEVRYRYVGDKKEIVGVQNLTHP